MRPSAPPIVLVDFHDSFTFNILAELYRFGGAGAKTEVVSWEKAAAYFQDHGFLDGGGERRAVVYGPGPGHPAEYASLFPVLERLLRQAPLFHLGICLGHQILWSIKGRRVERSKLPMHGQSVPFQIPPWGDCFDPAWIGQTVRVQRYNSLTLQMGSPPAEGEEFAYGQGECMSGRFFQGLTYQFHPESIGTSCPEVFFRPLFTFLQYNGTDGKAAPTH